MSFLRRGVLYGTRNRTSSCPFGKTITSSCGPRLKLKSRNAILRWGAGAAPFSASTRSTMAYFRVPFRTSTRATRSDRAMSWNRLSGSGAGPSWARQGRDPAKSVASKAPQTAVRAGDPEPSRSPNGGPSLMASPGPPDRGCSSRLCARPERSESPAQLGLVRLEAQGRLEGGNRPLLLTETQVGLAEETLQIRVPGKQACSGGQHVHDLGGSTVP